MGRHLLRLDLWWNGQRHYAAIEIDILEQETRAWRQFRQGEYEIE
jgi:hypothetical protein